MSPACSPACPTSSCPRPPQQVFIEHLPCVRRGVLGLVWKTQPRPQGADLECACGPCGPGRPAQAGDLGVCSRLLPWGPPMPGPGSVLTGVTLLPVIPGGWQSPACCYPPRSSSSHRDVPSLPCESVWEWRGAAPGSRLPRKLRSPQQWSYPPRPRPANAQPPGEPWTMGDVLVSSSQNKGSPGVEP